MAKALGETGRPLTPTHDDWVIAATLVARFARIHGKVELPHHPHDALVAVSAARITGEVITTNVKHFPTGARLARDGGLDVVVRPY